MCEAKLLLLLGTVAGAQLGLATPRRWLSSSMLHSASCRWQGVMGAFLMSQAALPAARRFSSDSAAWSIIVLLTAEPPAEWRPTSCMLLGS